MIEVPLPAATESARRQRAAANVVRLAETEKLLARLEAEIIPAVLLKGAALLLTVYRHPGDRPMTDVDLWLPFHSVRAVKPILEELGYEAVPDCPGEFHHRDDKDIRFDVTESLWFLPEGEIQTVWERAPRETIDGGSAAVLAPEDAFLYAVAHGLIHHGHWNEMWTEDLRRLAALPDFSWNALLDRSHRWGLNEVLYELLSSGAGPKIALNADAMARTLSNRISKTRLMILRRGAALTLSGRGLILRFCLLPGGRRFRELLRLFFPSADFLRDRYRESGPVPVWFLRVLRPFFLAGRFFRLFRRSF